MQDEARESVKRWEDGIRERELAEKRRVAPGWLDEEVRMLVPERKDGDAGAGGEQKAKDWRDVVGVAGGAGPGQGDGKVGREGEDLDRAFGGLGLK